MKRWLSVLACLAFVFCLTAGAWAEEEATTTAAAALKCPTCGSELVKGAEGYPKDLKSFNKADKCPGCGADVARSEEEGDALVCDKCETTFKTCDHCSGAHS